MIYNFEGLTMKKYQCAQRGCTFEAVERPDLCAVCKNPLILEEKDITEVVTEEKDITEPTKPPMKKNPKINTVKHSHRKKPPKKHP